MDQVKQKEADIGIAGGIGEGLLIKKGEIIKKGKGRRSPFGPSSGVVELERVSSEKKIFDVFPTLKTEEDLQALFRDVEVKKITTNTKQDFLHVHILSTHLIQKKKSGEWNKKIKEQLFGTVQIIIRIEEENIYFPGSILQKRYFWNIGTVLSRNCVKTVYWRQICTSRQNCI